MPKRVFRLFILIISIFFAWSCARPPTSLPRPSRAYLNLLEKESALGKAPALIAEVSQTERLWLNGVRGERSAILLNAAPVWYWPNPESVSARTLKNDLPPLANLGLKGVYLGDVDEDEEIWLENSPRAKLSLAAEAEALIAQVESAGLQTGVNLPAATAGRGPDFILQARNAPDHQGLYAMLAVPRENWNLLPPSAGEWDAAPIAGETLASLAQSGVLPAKLARDAFDWTDKGGWAATGEIIGADGQPRRWLYRFAENPRRPVMLWRDPSGAARKVLAAAVIKRTGLEGVTLAGLRVAAFMGLEPASQTSPDDASPLASGLDAVKELAAQIRAYGGWSLLADPLPPAGVKSALEDNCDFCRDDFTPLLLAHAFKSGDARPLARVYQHWRDAGLPFSRLARWPADASFDSRLLFSLAEGEKILGSSSETPSPAAFGAFYARWSLGSPGLVFLADDFRDPEILALIKNGEAAGRALGGNPRIISPSSSLLALLSEVKEGYWLVAGNFAANNATLKITLPSRASRALDAANGEDLSHFLSENGSRFSLRLDGKQARNVIFEVER